MRKRISTILIITCILTYFSNYNFFLFEYETVRASVTPTNTVPVVTAVAPISGQVISKGAIITPKCTVKDIDNNNLTVKYYLDSETNARETKSVSGNSTPYDVVFTALNTTTWLEGVHSLRFEVSDGIAAPVILTVSFTLVKVNYYYCKYTSVLKWTYSWKYSETYSNSGSGLMFDTNNFTFNDYTGYFTNTKPTTVPVVGPVGTFLRYDGGGEFRYDEMSERNYWEETPTRELTKNVQVSRDGYNYTLTYYKSVVTQIDAQGILVQSNIIAEDGTYPVNGKHTDGYWYVRGILANTLPTITSINPAEGQSISNFSSKTPKCTVQDADGNILTVKYYIDTETIARESKTITDTSVCQTVTFSDLNTTGLSEGNHSIKFQVSDGIGNPVTKIVSFIIDNTGHIIDSMMLSSTEKTISIETLLSNSNSETEVNPCRFSIGSSTSNWINTPRYTFEALIPNTSYTVRSEFQNVFGNITTNEKSIYTKAQKPSLVADNITSTTIDLKVISENPEDTQYQIMCDSKYVDSNGTLSEIPTWITIPHKIMKIVGLSPNLNYNFKIKAKNMEGIETAFSNPIDLKVYVEAPSNLVTTPSSTSIVLTWNSVPGAYEYEVEADGVVKTVKSTTYKHTVLIPDTQHSYRVRAKTIYGFSDWSPITTVITNYNVPENIMNIKAYPASKAITFIWDVTLDAQNYDVEFDGVEVTRIKDTFYTISGLKPNTQHSYRIRAVNSAGEGSWSDSAIITTFLLDTPENIKTIKDENYITLNWDSVKDAYTYTIEANGRIIGNVTDNSFKHEGLEEDTKYVYRIKAENSQGESAWTDEVIAYTLPARPAVPENLLALSEDKGIVLMWDSVTDAIGYDVELDGVLIENGNNTKYIDEELNKSSLHKYRVRAKNSAIEGEWTDYLTVKTMAGRPEVPAEIKIESTPTIATITWKTEDEALGYDIEIDGIQVDAVTETSYRHKKLIPGSEHVYRIRTRNVTGVSQWSGYIINNSLKAICKKGKEVDLGLTASGIVDFSKYTLTVIYNPDVIEVTDLCTLSPRIELSKGKIDGTGITITDYIPGKIVFVVDKTIPPGESWTGVINSIKFKAKVSGGTSITYTVYSKSEE